MSASKDIMQSRPLKLYVYATVFREIQTLRLTGMKKGVGWLKSRKSPAMIYVQDSLKISSDFPVGLASCNCQLKEKERRRKKYI